MPDPITVGVLVVEALRLGAEAVVKSAVGEAVKDAYTGLKNKISVWAASDVTALEKQPNSSLLQTVITGIVDSLSAADRDSLRSLAQVLTNELEKQAPKIVGLDVGRLKALQAAFGNISVTEGIGVHLQDVKAGRVIIDDISAGRTSVGIHMNIIEANIGGIIGARPGVVSVPVWYATDRKSTGLPQPNSFFSGARGVLSYGVAEVTIPTDRHRMGELEQPSFWRLEFTEDPARHVVLASITPKREVTFFRNLRRRIEKTEGGEAFVFVHGFNVDFKDAARRAGQMAWDLNFDGVPILYSWPSQARVKDYAVDSTNAEWTIPHLGEFLSKLTQLSGARTIHLVSHSMGNRPLLYALERFAHDRAIFNEIVLAAPDIDTEVFMKIAEGMRHTGKRITLYASSRDRALRLSKRFNGYPRAGDVTDRVAVADGVETVDASAVNTNLLGHSYYGGSRSVLSDIFYLLRGIAVGSRAGIRQSTDKTYWIFQP